LSVEITKDLRYNGMTEFGRSELAVYLQWIKDASLADTEYSFIAYVMGRAGIRDARHLYQIWEQKAGGSADQQLRRQIRRFFLNPSQTVSFEQPGSAGWFDFIASVYEVKDKLPPIAVTVPSFTKVGFNKLPDRGSAEGYV
jgi:hypothetical protein